MALIKPVPWQMKALLLLEIRLYGSLYTALYRSVQPRIKNKSLLTLNKSTIKRVKWAKFSISLLRKMKAHIAFLATAMFWERI